MCGIAGAFGIENAAYVVSQMLKQPLQHRGQEAAGIASTDGEKIFLIKGPGLADEVFSTVNFDRDLPGRSAVGHLRYATSGDTGDPESIQPLRACLRQDQSIAVVHNGNLTNADPIRTRLQEGGAIYRSGSDTENFLHLLARALAPDVSSQFRETFAAVEGAYALLGLTSKGLYAAVDPCGFRPLVMAPYKGGWLFASETCALDLFCATGTEIKPGQLIELTGSGMQTHAIGSRERPRHCSFEHVYFSRPDSEVFGKSVDEVRENLGNLLAEKAKLAGIRQENAVVAAVPDSANVEALAFAYAIGVPFAFALIRSHYAGRTFITPKQIARELGVRMKLNPVKRRVANRIVYAVDDSLVRGTTGSKVVKLLREAGAREVHMFIASPPVIHPCYWGIDTPERRQLVAAQKSTEQIREMMGVDSLTYLTVEELRAAIGDPEGKEYCTTCFTGERPIEGQLIPPEHLAAPARH